MSASGKIYPSSASITLLAVLFFAAVVASSVTSSVVVSCVVGCSVVILSPDSPASSSDTDSPASDSLTSSLPLPFDSCCTAFFKDDDCPLSLFPLVIIIAISAMATTAITTPKEMMICFSFFFILFSSSLIIPVNTICNSFCKH